MKLKHFDHDGRARFITFCIHRQIPILTNDPFRQIVVDSIDDLRRQEGFRLLAYVIMPEHIHLVLIPGENTEIGPLVGEIKRISALRIHEILLDKNSHLLNKFVVQRDRHSPFALWQRRCHDHNCRTDDAVWSRVEYCHFNPVTRGLVRNPEDWVWSSYRWYQGKRNVPLKIDFACDRE